MAHTVHSTRRTVLKAGLMLATSGHAAIVSDDIENAPTDPLINALRAYAVGISAFDTIKEDDWPLHGG